MLAVKYTKKDFKQWSEKYKECLSFAKVGRYFDVDKSIIGRKLKKYKDELGINLKEEINNNLLKSGLKKCSHCFEILEISKFNKNRGECKRCKSGTDKKYRFNNKKDILIKKGIYYKTNRDMILIKQATCHKNRRNKRNEYQKNKRKANINYKLACNLRTRFKRALKDNYKSGSAVKDLGCTIDEFKNYLEHMFYSNPITGKDMTWKNYGRAGWHIDHIKPLLLFNLTDREQFLEVCRYTNLQPLWKEDHVIKTAKDKKLGSRSGKK